MSNTLAIVKIGWGAGNMGGGSETIVCKMIRWGKDTRIQARCVLPDPFYIVTIDKFEPIVRRREEFSQKES